MSMYPDQAFAAEPKPETSPPPQKGSWLPFCLAGCLVIGVLCLLICVGVSWFVARNLSSGTASASLQAADEAYRSQSYSQAIPQYERFLAQYPADPHASLARVRLGTARIWQVLKGSPDKQPALKAAEEILPTMENEAAFDEARAELASILLEIAEGFSQPAKIEADTKKAQSLVDLAQQAMKLVNNPGYIPTTLRKPVEARIASISADIDLAKRNIVREGGKGDRRN